MLFGTSFTSRPRAVLGAVESGAAADRDLVLRRTIDLISARLDDLLTALAAPGNDERRLFARALLQRRGLRFATVADRDAARKYLLAAVIRVANEQDQIDQELGATSGGDPITEFVQRSRLFRTRGLSLDTSLITNYSVEQALAAMKARGLLKPGAVRRVAIVGPGLDFADKDVGFDIYPQQTLQPFAVLDSLKRLGLAPSPGDPEIVLLDISPRVIDHVTQARARAAKNIGYTLNLPLPRSTPWLPEVRTYWQTFGDQIGAPAQAPASKAIADVAELRAVRARPSAVQRMSVLNVNIVTERLDGGSVRSRDCHERVHLLRPARAGAGDVERRSHAEARRVSAGERLSAESDVGHDSPGRNHDHPLRARTSSISSSGIKRAQIELTA